MAANSEAVMEQRLFRLLCLMAAALTFLVLVPVEALIGLPAGVIAPDLAFGLGALCLYWQARAGRFLIQGLFWIYLADLALSWYPHGGSQGSMPFFFFNAFFYTLIFFRGRQRFTLLVTALALLVALLLSELFVPHMLIQLPDASARLIDVSVAVVLTAVSCAIMLQVVLANYDSKHAHLKSLNADLQRTILERSEAEHSLRQNRELLHSVIEGTSDAVFAKDQAGRYVLFNSAAAQLTGWPVEEALGRDDSWLFPEDVAVQIMARDREIMASGQVCNLEHALPNSCGETLVLQATKGPLRDGDGAIIGVFGISRDVTDQRRVEQEIRMLNAELDLRVMERTARLEAAIKEQESFSYSVSHDLRAPLCHINSYSAILAEECADCLPPEALGHLERIRNSSRSMGQLIDDLLELSRVSRSPMRRTQVNLSDMATEIFFRFKEQEPQRRVQVVVAPDLTVQGDPALLHLVLASLLDNAWKYTSQRGAACIEVGRKVDGSEDTFFVRDNGVGFEMAYRDKLFGAFQRLHGAEFEGTGIGLAMVMKIVKRHGGRVWAEGEVDAGATIYFTLPDQAGAELLPLP
jgi:PAS domain S-box-containing protein